jgi:hypothetical protein
VAPPPAGGAAVAAAPAERQLPSRRGLPCTRPARPCTLARPPRFAGGGSCRRQAAACTARPAPKVGTPQAYAFERRASPASWAPPGSKHGAGASWMSPASWAPPGSKHGAGASWMSPPLPLPLPPLPATHTATPHTMWHQLQASKQGLLVGGRVCGHSVVPAAGGQVTGAGGRREGASSAALPLCCGFLGGGGGRALGLSGLA